MSDDASPRLGLPYVAAAQAQKHVTINEAFARLDGLVQLAVESRQTAAQPSSPTDGAVYIIPTGATGADWSAFAAGRLARFEAGAWTVLTPTAGALAWVTDEALLLVFDGSAWGGPGFPSIVAAQSPHGAQTRLEIREETLSLTGPSVTSAITLPDRCIVLGVSTRTVTAVTGATSYSCGVSGDLTKFGSLLGGSAGAQNIGVIGPTALYADTPIVLTAAGGDFTGGGVRLSAHVLVFTAPDAL